MRQHLLAGVASALLLLPVAAMAQQSTSGASQNPPVGSESLTGKNTTGAERSGGTPSATGPGNTAQGTVTGNVPAPKAGSETLTDPQTTGASRSSGTPSPTNAGSTTGGSAPVGSGAAGSDKLTPPATTGAAGSGGQPTGTKGQGGG